MKTELIDLLTLDDALTLFPGSDREEVEHWWNARRAAIRTLGKGDDVQFITVMLGASIPVDQSKGKKDGDPIPGDFMMERFESVRQMLEKRRAESQQ